MLGHRKNENVQEVAVTITTETFLRLAALTVGTIILLLAAKKASHALLLIFIAFFLALALNAPVHAISERLPGKKRGSRALATTISVLFVVLLLVGFIASITPPLVRQTSAFVDQAPGLVRDFRSQDSATGRFIRQYHLEKQVNTFSDQLTVRLKNSGGTAFKTVQRISSSVFSLITILVLTFMMLVEGPRWLGFFHEIIPNRKRAKADLLMEDMYNVVKGYVNGQVLLAALAAILIMPVVLLLKIDYPIALMVIIFFCGLIPMVGHTIGAIIVTIVALFESTSAAIIVLAYYILYQQIENVFVQPRIQANSTNMSPLLVFASIVVGVSFGGLIGGLVAIPIAGCIRILLLDYLRDRKIIDSPTYEKAVTDTK